VPLERAARLFGVTEMLNEMTGRIDPDERDLSALSIAALHAQLDPAALAVS
jgi:hypothetical protein